MNLPLLDLIAGARPNFIKLAPVARALQAAGGLRLRIVHTGQHYDPGMSQVFFDELGIPEPHVHLDVGSASHGAQMARILERYEALLLEHPPAATVVFGDVNSTVACALAAVKLHVPVAHVEAGLRSFDRSMPEEINRILTDALSDLLLVSEPCGVENLRREGIDEGKVHLVGNVMIDALFAEITRARAEDVPRQLGLTSGAYGVVTLHRPANVDRPEVLGALLRLLHALASELPLVFPMHPRTRAAAERSGLAELIVTGNGLRVIDPVPYRQNLALMAGAKVVLTDSGGMQEETTVLGIPCLTCRENTERPVTVERGTSRLVGSDPERIRAAFRDVMDGRWPTGEAIPLWDGKASLRVVDALVEWVGGNGRAC